MTSQYQTAAVNDDELKEIQALESDLGTVLVAVESRPAYADLQPDQLARLQSAEKKLGVVLLAYENH